MTSHTCIKDWISQKLSQGKSSIAHTLNAQTLNLLQQTAQYFNSQRQQAYLVGGSLRNILLGEDGNDWDIVTSGDAPSSARRLADKLGGHYVNMHDKASRVVVPLPEGTQNEEHEVIFDISRLRGNTIEEDLRQRDFTINAIAAPLDEVIRHLETGETIRHIIDPLHGQADIEAHRLKAVDSDVFRHDPLRLLRAARLMARYRLSIDSWTEGLLLRDASLLPQVAPQRIHDELYALLELDGATEHLHFLDAHGLLTVLIPEFISARGMPQPSPHYWDVLEHSLQTVGKLELLASLLQQTPEEIQQSPLEIGGERNLVEIQHLLQEAEEQGIFQRSMLTAPRMKLAALLHDIGKPVTYATDEEGLIHFYGHPQAGVPLAQQVMKRLSASTQDRRLVQQVVGHHMRPGQLAHVPTVTPRAIRRYFVDLGPTGMAVALLSLADHLATRGPLIGIPEREHASTISAWEQHVAAVCLLLTRYIRNRESLLPPRLISPEELMRRLKLEPGPRVGLLLEYIAEAQAEGILHSKEEALWLAEEKLLAME